MHAEPRRRRKFIRLLDAVEEANSARKIAYAILDNCALSTSAGRSAPGSTATHAGPSTSRPPPPPGSPP